MSIRASEADRGGTASGRMAWSGDKKKQSTPSYETNQERSNKGCWSVFSGCVGGMWVTRQMNQKDDRETYVRTTLRELVVYIIFLTILCIITFGMTSSTMFYYTKVLNDLFLDTPFPDDDKSFRDATQVIHFWAYVENVLMDALYWEYWYDPEKTPTQGDDRNILYENRMLGVPRMRQIRVTNDSCDVPEGFSKVIKQCYAAYNEKFEDKNPYGDMNGTAWTYHANEELDSSSYWGQIDTYSGAGFYIDFGTDKNSTKTMLAELREKLWIDRGTRVVFIDFTVYNANINYFCVIKLVIEFPATGGIFTSWSFKTVQLLRYVSPMDYFILACEIIFLFFILYYIVEEVIEIGRHKCEYFKGFWNLLDLLVIGLSLLCIGFNVFCILTIDSKLEDLLSTPDDYANFQQLGYWQVQFNSTIAVCVFFAWFKLFKYISFNKTMTQLFSTLSRCAKDVIGFGVMFFIVFFAFAQLGYLLFGTQVSDFSSFINAVFTLLRTILGDFNFQAIEEANRILGPLFFLSYVFFVFFVLLNMFLAIINDTYSEVKSEIASQKNEFEIADYFKRGYNNMLGKFGRRDKLIDIENALKLSDHSGDGRLSFDECRKNLKKCNFSDMEIEMLFARYDIDGNRLLEPEEIKRMLSDLECKRNEIDSQQKPLVIHQEPPPSAERPKSAQSARPRTGRNIGPGVSQDEFLILQKRVDGIENNLGSVVNKIDVVLLKLDAMEKSKHKRNEHMGKMFDEIIGGDDEDRIPPPN